MENVTWGSVPTKRTRKVEKYSTPVLTLSSLEKKGAGRKFSFNKAAIEALELDDTKAILFGHSKTQTLFKVVDPSTEGSIPLTKTCSLSNKKHYEFIIDSLSLSDQVENEFDIIPHTDHSSITLKVSSEEVTLMEVEDSTEGSDTKEEVVMVDDSLESKEFEEEETPKSSVGTWSAEEDDVFENETNESAALGVSFDEEDEF